MTTLNKAQAALLADLLDGPRYAPTTATKNQTMLIDLGLMARTIDDDYDGLHVLTDAGRALLAATK